MSNERVALVQQIKIFEDQVGYMQPVVTQPMMEELIAGMHSIAKAMRRQLEYSDACVVDS